MGGLTLDQMMEGWHRAERRKQVAKLARQLLVAATAGGAGFESLEIAARAACDMAEAMYAEQDRREKVPEFADQP